MSTIEEIGKSIASIITTAIDAGRSKQEALDEAAEKLRRGDVVSDVLWEKLQRYIAETSRFESEGS